MGSLLCRQRKHGNKKLASICETLSFVPLCPCGGRGQQNRENFGEGTSHAAPSARSPFRAGEYIKRCPAHFDDLLRRSADARQRFPARPLSNTSIEDEPCREGERKSLPLRRLALALQICRTFVSDVQWKAFTIPRREKVQYPTLELSKTRLFPLARRGGCRAHA